MKKINLESDKMFILNPDNGRWGISKKEGLSDLEYSLISPKLDKVYTGVNLFVLNSSNKCNLDCVYCSEREHRFGRSIQSDLGREIIDKILEIPNPSVVFHGSEPTLNFDFIKEIVEYGEEEAKKKENPITFSIQSNLAFLPKDFVNFIKKYHVGVSTSLDGFPEVHNLTRPFLGGRGSYEIVMKNLKKILDVQGNINVSTVITKHNVEKLVEISHFFESQGITSWQTIPAEGVEISPNPTTLGNSYVALFNEVFSKLKENKQELQIRTLSQYLVSMFNHNGIDACRLCSSASSHPLLAIDKDGMVYPCDFFWGNPNLSIGTIQDLTPDTLIRNKNNLRMRDINQTVCYPCEWKNLCGGGCLAGAYFSGDKTKYCETHKITYEYLARKMPELIETNLILPIFKWISK